MRSIFFFFFNDTATTEIYTLSLHDALPISWLNPEFAPRAPGDGILRQARLRDPPSGSRQRRAAFDSDPATRAPRSRRLLYAAGSSLRQPSTPILRPAHPGWKRVAEAIGDDAGYVRDVRKERLRTEQGIQAAQKLLQQELPLHVGDRVALGQILYFRITVLVGDNYHVF